MHELQITAINVVIYSKAL